MNFLPLCTARVWPTISGMTVERRDQVLMTFFSAPRFITSTFSRSDVSTNGPFFSDLDIGESRDLVNWQLGNLVIGYLPTYQFTRLPIHFCRLCTMKRSVRFRLRVL